MILTHLRFTAYNRPHLPPGLVCLKTAKSGGMSGWARWAIAISTAHILATALSHPLLPTPPSHAPPHPPHTPPPLLLHRPAPPPPPTPSSTAIYNEILRRRADLIPVMSGTWYMDRKKVGAWMSGRM
jgi:hypothetical protein